MSKKYKARSIGDCELCGGSISDTKILTWKCFEIQCLRAKNIPVIVLVFVSMAVADAERPMLGEEGIVIPF